MRQRSLAQCCEKPSRSLCLAPRNLTSWRRTTGCQKSLDSETGVVILLRCELKKRHGITYIRMAIKVKATKTINPLHFEDLEPHRFEDLVRRLLYSFRDWSNIEATGRSGSDEGFDVRAWEKGDAVTNVSDEGEEGMHALEGRLWQVQGKREKTIIPAKIRTLIREGVDQASPPYGYILAAATNISKAAYDTFRE